MSIIDDMLHNCGCQISRCSDPLLLRVSHYFWHTDYVVQEQEQRLSTTETTHKFDKYLSMSLKAPIQVASRALM